MLNFPYVCKRVIFLFLVLCAPSFIHSENRPLSADEANTLNELIANEDAQRNLTGEIDLTAKCKKHKKLTYYLFIQDFINSAIEIPTSNVSVDSTTIASSYLAGRAPVYNQLNEKAGTCSASFLNMQNADGIYTDISNFLSVDNGIVVSWLTPTTLINLELDSIINSMVTECIVVASTKIGFNPYYGDVFNMIVSSDGTKIYFELTKL